MLNVGPEKPAVDTVWYQPDTVSRPFHADFKEALEKWGDVVVEGGVLISR
jgi:hypothetical protein